MLTSYYYEEKGEFIVFRGKTQICHLGGLVILHIPIALELNS